MKQSSIPTGFESRFAQVTPDVRLHYVIGGKGEPLVLLHGWPETWYAWRKVAPVLAKRYTVIAPDLRGFGDSSRPAKGYDRKTLASDVRTLVHQLGYNRVCIAGHDWGGSTAAAYAVAWPLEVRGLAVFEALPRGPWTTKDPEFREPWFYELHRTTGLPETLTAGREREYLTYFYRSFSANPNTISPAEVNHYLETYGSPSGMRAGFELVRALPQDVIDNSTIETNKLTLPVLAVAGGRGMGAAVADNLAHISSTVQSQIIPEAGHFIPEETPEKLTALLIKFFATVQ